MPPPKFPTRAQQSVTRGLGQVFTSPVKRHARPEKKKAVAPMGHEAKRRRLQAELDALLRGEEDALLQNSPSFQGVDEENLQPEPEPHQDIFLPNDDEPSHL